MIQHDPIETQFGAGDLEATQEEISSVALTVISIFGFALTLCVLIVYFLI